jgi:hypothetical protein
MREEGGAAGPNGREAERGEKMLFFQIPFSFEYIYIFQKYIINPKTVFT